MTKPPTKIYTKTGDYGTTEVGHGQRLSKDHLCIELLGTLDELSSVIGIVRAVTTPLLSPLFERIQTELLERGHVLCHTDNTQEMAADLSRLEAEIDQFTAELPPLKYFVLPGTNQAEATCHLARTICRRAERRLIAWHDQHPVSLDLLAYLNRLSDWLFTMARVMTQQEN